MSTAVAQPSERGAALADPPAQQQAEAPAWTGRKPMVVIVTGPTAVGKTAISLGLAQRLRGPGGGPGEVISADSVQVYEGLDVGSDKLPPSERQGVPHHLIDVRQALEDFSAGDFFEEGRRAAEDIVRRGGVPLVVGGTGLYLRWFVIGKGGAPPATPEAEARVRAAMEGAWRAAARAKAAAAEGGGEKEAEGAAHAAEAEADPAAGLSEGEKWEAAAALLKEWGDEEAYSRIRAERNNYYRLERALCILAMAPPGARLADFDPREQAEAREPDYDFRCFFLHRPRLALYERISQRVESMVAGGGLLEEAAGLLGRGLAPAQNMAAKAIGYRQAMEWLLACRASGRTVGLADLLELHGSICKATHKLVRSQMTWFRDDPQYLWVDVEGRPAAEVVDQIMAELAREQHQGGCGDSGRLSKADEKALMRHRPGFTMLEEATREAAARAAAAAAEAAAAAAAEGRRPPKAKSKTAAAAEAAAEGTAAVEARLAPLLERINGVLLPGIPEAALAAAAAARGKGVRQGAEGEGAEGEGQGEPGSKRQRSGESRPQGAGAGAEAVEA
ncbi:hypothetical protein HYH03_008348 [Edaphochlamys debaryana]|uniref:tRNA dimethylallyltransferase n=1 Tax=Edaphochlamys debaryana TaxID=47281 RepID=A0A835Y9L2_9CHLO|nr:hypothetical protein HYH03_008348 [Edaphochlamys debaryana]|eukprot:KAG2493534.1 hypothetical protein HYH03_008348 [Edaphochlamys debaryana]